MSHSYTPSTLLSISWRPKITNDSLPSPGCSLLTHRNGQNVFIPLSKEGAQLYKNAPCTHVLFPDAPRKGKGGLEENDIGGEEAVVQGLILPDIRGDDRAFERVQGRDGSSPLLHRCWTVVLHLDG